MPLVGFLLWATLLIVGWWPSYSKDYLFATPRVQLTFKGKAQPLCLTKLWYHGGLFGLYFLAFCGLLKVLYLEGVSESNQIQAWRFCFNFRFIRMATPYLSNKATLSSIFSWDPSHDDEQYFSGTGSEKPLG